MLGISVEEFTSLADKILSNLGFVYADNTAIIPRWRSPDDMNIPADIYEEVARIHGYDNIPAQKLTGENSYVPYSSEVALQRLVEDYLIHDARMDQAETYPRSHEERYKLFGHGEQSYYTIINPSSPETSKLRPDMIYSMLDFVEKNHRTFDEIRGFDTGMIRPEIDGQTVETKVLGAVVYRKSISDWTQDTILELKAHTTQLLNKLGVQKISFSPTTHEWFHPKKQARIIADDKDIGYIATVHPLVQQHYKLGETTQTSIVSINMNELKEYIGKSDTRNRAYTTLQDQIVYRDICFVINKSDSWETLLSAIKAIETIDNIEIFDLYA